MNPVMTAYAEARECSSCEGQDRWYWRKRAWINAHRGDVPLPEAVAVYAVCSQNASVAENDKNFLRAMRGEPVRHFGDVQRRVDVALGGQITLALTYKNGRKIPSFYTNLLYPWRRWVGTMDRHAGDIITGDRRVTKNMLARKSGYAELENQYKEVAMVYDTTTAAIQARTWCHRLMCEEAVA